MYTANDRPMKYGDGVCLAKRCWNEGPRCVLGHCMPCCLTNHASMSHQTPAAPTYVSDTPRRVAPTTTEFKLGNLVKVTEEEM